MPQAIELPLSKKQFINIENQYEYKGKETWWSPKVGELSETYQMFSGNVY